MRASNPSLTMNLCRQNVGEATRDVMRVSSENWEETEVLDLLSRAGKQFVTELGRL